MDASKITAQALMGGEKAFSQWCLPFQSSTSVNQAADVLNSIVGASVIILTALATLTVSVMLYNLLLKIKYNEAKKIDVLAFLGSLGLLFSALYVWNLAGVVLRLFLTSDTTLFIFFVGAIILNGVIALVFIVRGTRDIGARFLKHASRLKKK